VGIGLLGAAVEHVVVVSVAAVLLIVQKQGLVPYLYPLTRPMAATPHRTGSVGIQAN